MRTYMRMHAYLRAFVLVRIRTPMRLRACVPAHRRRVCMYIIRSRKG